MGIRRHAWGGRARLLRGLLVLSAGLPFHASLADTPVEAELRARLTLELERTQTEKSRWERFVRTQRELTQNPGQLSAAVTSAAQDLKGNGMSLVAEGVTGGLSNLVSLQAAYAKEAGDSASERQLKTVATLVSSAHTLIIKDLVAQKLGAPQPSAATNDAVGKINAALKLVILATVSDPNLRAGLNASLDLTKGMSGFLTAYLAGDELTMQRLLPAVQGALAGTLAMTKALAARPSGADLEGFAAALGRQLPGFAPVAKMMATTALTDFNISLALANIGWGGYAIAQGFELEAQAQEIRDDQMRAAERMRVLLPKAQASIARAQAREQQLSAALEAMGPAPAPPPPVQPSARFVDDSPRYTLLPATLPTMVTAIRETPSLSINLTMRELDRRVDRQRAITEAEREAERRRIAEEHRRAEEARRAAAAEARRRAAEERARRAAERWESGESDRSSRREPSSSYSPRSSGSDGFERARRAVERARTWRF